MRAVWPARRLRPTSTVVWRRGPGSACRRRRKRLRRRLPCFSHRRLRHERRHRQVVAPTVPPSRRLLATTPRAARTETPQIARAGNIVRSRGLLARRLRPDGSRHRREPCTSDAPVVAGSSAIAAAKDRAAPGGVPVTGHQGISADAANRGAARSSASDHGAPSAAGSSDLSGAAHRDPARGRGATDRACFIAASGGSSGAARRAFECGGPGSVPARRSPRRTTPGRAARGFRPAGGPAPGRACQSPRAESGRAQVATARAAVDGATGSEGATGSGGPPELVVFQVTAAASRQWPVTFAASQVCGQSGLLMVAYDRADAARGPVLRCPVAGARTNIKEATMPL